MDSPRTYYLLLLALLVCCFGMAAHLQPEFQFMHLNDNQKKWVLDWHGTAKPVCLSRQNGDIFQMVLGDSRKMFANSFYVKADEYYHSGYYPSIFDDNTAFQTAHMAADTGAVSTKNQGDEHGFLGPTRNWIDAFNRQFLPNRHTHLDEGGAADDLSSSDEVREILPWLKLSADLDPDNVQTYTVTAFWLRDKMKNTPEAEAVLHEGLRNCPGSYDILFELGRLYTESYHDTNRARNVWEYGVEQWKKINPTLSEDEQKDNKLIMEQLATHLAKLEEDAGHLQKAVAWLEEAKTVSGTADVIQKDINRLNYKLGQELIPGLKPIYQ